MKLSDGTIIKARILILGSIFSVGIDGAAAFMVNETRIQKDSWPEARKLREEIEKEMEASEKREGEV